MTNILKQIKDLDSLVSKLESEHIKMIKFLNHQHELYIQEIITEKERRKMEIET